MYEQRGKNIYRGMDMNGEWRYGSLIYTTIGNTKTWLGISARGNGGWFNLIQRVYVKPDTVGQFTGRCDKNGTPIFEGDYVKCFDTLNEVNFEGYVDFNNCSFAIRSHAVAHYRWMDYEVEVIGNIHENEELIDVEALADVGTRFI
jgi:hypothetical protein